VLREGIRLTRARDALTSAYTSRVCAEIDLGRAKDAAFAATRKVGVCLTQFENEVRADERLKQEKKAAALAPKAAKK